VLLLLAIYPSFIQGQDSISTKQNFWNYMINPDSTHHFRTKIIPILYSSPETSFGFGAGLIFNWDFKNATAQTFSSRAQSSFIYTLNSQVNWKTSYAVFTNSNKFVFKGIFSYNLFPQFFYGVGNDLTKANRELFDYKQVYIDLNNRYRVFSGIYIGIDYFYKNLYDVSWVLGDSSKFWNNPELYGTNGYKISGLGPGLTFDTRDNALYPNKGAYLNFSFLFFGSPIGSQYQYRSFRMNLRKYISINKQKRRVLGINLLGNFSWNQTVFNQIPALGNDEIMRGYYSGSFRGYSYIALQVEWRMQIWSFLGLAAWLGAGEVGNSVKEYTWDGIKPNVGIGIRLLYDKASGANLRLDQGFGENSNGFYLGIGEAF